MRDTPEFEQLRASCFGKLFELPARQCPVSCKLIHSLLSRQLLDDLKYTLWTAFGGKPLRFGLQEFGTITGLPCGDFPDGYVPDYEEPREPQRDPIWLKLIGKSKMTTIADIGKRLQRERNMPGSKKLRLALIMIVDGVLIAHKQYPRPTLRYVQMVDNLDEFFKFLWGRESFLKTINCMKPDPLVDDPVGTMVINLKQESYRLQEFPLTLQLLAFTAIPRLQEKIPAPPNQLTIMDLNVGHLPTHHSINLIEICRVENEPNVSFFNHISIFYLYTT